MRINLGRIGLLIGFLLVSACAAKQVVLPVKYDLGDKLEQVPEIRDMRIGGGGRAPSFLIIKDHDEFIGDSITKRDTFTLSENKDEWIKLDIQSLILRNGQDEYYLLVLQRPAYNLLEVDTISFVNMLNVLRAKKDLVGIGGQKYVIERIFKIESSDIIPAIKNRILGG